MADSTVPTDTGKPKVVWWCRVVVNRPKLMFGLTLGGHLLFCVITAVLVVARYDILPIVFNDLPLQINDDKFFLRKEALDNRFAELDSNDELEPLTDRTQDVITKTDTRRRKRSFGDHRFHVKLSNLPNSIEDMMQQWEMAPLKGVPRTYQWASDFEEEPDEITRRRRRDVNDSTTDTDEDIWERRYQLLSVQIIYEEEGGNVFTKDNLRSIAKFEFELFNNETYQKRFCQLMKIFNTYQCRPFSSILRIFDGTIDNDLYDPSFTDVGGTLAKAYADEDHQKTLKYYLGINAKVNSTSVQSDLTRSFIYYGRPFPENLDRWEDSRSDEMDGWKLWAYRDVIPKLKKTFENGLDNMSFAYVGNGLYYEEALRQVFTDWYWLMGSVLFIFFFMWFQTSSLWITGWGMLSVVTCFVGANLVYNIVFDFKFFGIFNVLAIFIVLGVGADDIFVFVDTWRLLEDKAYSLEERLSECYRRAAVTMLVTSLTTMVAFFVSGFSPLLSVSAFGVFAGTAILVNYMSVIVFFPTVVIMHHIYYEKKACCCCATCCCGNTNTIKSAYTSDTTEDLPQFTRNKSTDNLTIKKDDGKRITSKVGVVSRFFEGPFFNLVTHRAAKWVIMALSLALAAGAVYFCSILENDPDSQFKLFRPHNVFEIAFNKLKYSFVENEGDTKLEVAVYWGLGPQDRSECPLRRWDRLNRCDGKTVWDEKFDMNTPESQTAMLNFCKDMKLLKGDVKEKLRIQLNSDSPAENDVNCFLEDMDTFFRVNVSGSSKYPNLTIGIPITKQNVQDLIAASPDIFRPDAMQFVSRPFEVAHQFWITKGHGSFNFSDDERRVLNSHSGNVGLRRIGRTNLAWNYKTTYDDEIYQKKIKFAGITIVTNATYRRLSLKNGLELMDEWETFTNAKLKTLPAPLKNGWQASRRWPWFSVQHSLVQQGVMGIGIGLALSFVIIFIGTQNIIIAVLATIVLGCVSAFVIAMIPISGWKMGLLEALNLCLVVGLSVDYIVHLAEAYYLSSSVTRGERTKDALKKVGISIVSGAFTTLGASFFMFFAEILFFMQFGLFIFCTIGFSMLLSLFFFSALLCTFGPEGDQGSIKPLLVKFKNYLCGTCCVKKHQVENQPAHFQNEAFDDERPGTAETRVE